MRRLYLSRSTQNHFLVFGRNFPVFVQWMMPHLLFPRRRICRALALYVSSAQPFLHAAHRRERAQTTVYRIGRPRNTNEGDRTNQVYTLQFQMGNILLSQVLYHRKSFSSLIFRTFSLPRDCLHSSRMFLFFFLAFLFGSSPRLTPPLHTIHTIRYVATFEWDETKHRMKWKRRRTKLATSCSSYSDYSFCFCLPCNP